MYFIFHQKKKKRKSGDIFNVTAPTSNTCDTFFKKYSHLFAWQDIPKLRPLQRTNFNIPSEISESGPGQFHVNNFIKLFVQFAPFELTPATQSYSFNLFLLCIFIRLGQRWAPDITEKPIITRNYLPLWRIPWNQFIQLSLHRATGLHVACKNARRE